MKKIITTLLLSIVSLIGCDSVAYGLDFNNETLHYVISYKWGLIHKDAGEATLALKNKNNCYSIVLSAKTKPWADKIFKVRDTLKSTIRIDGFRPLSYTKISHEGGKYGKDHIAYSYANGTISAECTRLRIKEGKESESKITLSSTLEAYDMLSIFYYIRNLDFSKMGNGRTVKATIFSGKRKEKISIRCLGVEDITLRDKSTRKAYHIKFNFTTDGGKKSSDDMDTWISVDNNRIPLQLEASLPIGKVKCYYTPK